MKTPLAVFCYKRPEHVDRLLGSLAECRRLEEVEIHYFCDGPAKREDNRGVKETRAVAERWRKRLGGKMVARSTNNGLARSINNGASSLCAESGRVIVLEDDLIVNADFLDFHLRALDHYANEEKVWQISGFGFRMKPVQPDEPYFLPIISTWGWSTWQRAWSKFDPATPSVESLPKDAATISRFNIDDAYPYVRMLEDSVAGRNDSWGIRWNWTVFQHDGLVLYPPQSLAYNAGYDGSGAHCHPVETVWQPSRAEVLGHGLPTDLKFPTASSVAAEQRAQLKNLLQKM